MDFGLFYFSAHDSAASTSPYALLLEGARFADSHRLAAVWTPERHFSPWGGPYPNAAVTGAAVAAVTERVSIRAGSVVLPLHNPLRVAEDWALVDNLSNGRVAVSFAPGNTPDDFALAPDSYAARRETMLRGVDQVRRLWRGEAVTVPNGTGNARSIVTYPRPVQPELQFFLTSGGRGARLDTPILAGGLGAGLLTHMVGQDLSDLKQRVDAYRAARADAGLDPEGGRVVVMLHTFVEEGADTDPVVGSAIESYVGGFVDMRRVNFQTATADEGAERVHRERRVAVRLARDRYLSEASLIGSIDKCSAVVQSLAAAGVDELACLIDFGLAHERVMHALNSLAVLAARHRALSAP